MFESDNCSNRWNSIYEFIEIWTGVKLEQEKFQKLVLKIERKLGSALPLSVKRWISFSESSSSISNYFSYRDCLEGGWLEGFEIGAATSIIFGVRRLADRRGPIFHFFDG